MKFKQYAKMQRLNCHKNILSDLCIEFNDCGQCIDEDVKQPCCNPLAHMDNRIFDVNAISFKMDGFAPIELCANASFQKIKTIAERNGYKCGIIMVDFEHCVKFEKEV